MITLKGIIDLNFEKAPDVALRLGDTMREAEFELAQDVNINDCTVSVFVVKPDLTFVTSTGTITEDGKIVIAWSDQVAAVKGLGEYCIRISDNNDGYVYSARGKIWIDDHCVMEDMIESVAEANGMVFPDDFLTRNDISDIMEIVEHIIDDDVTSDSRTWSSEKISDELSQFKPLKVYSTTEQLYGIWLDNKPIYCISGVLNEQINTNYKTLIDCASLNIDKVVNAEIMLYENSYYYSNTTNIVARYNPSTKKFQISTTQYTYDGGALATIYYTKNS